MGIYPPRTDSIKVSHNLSLECLASAVETKNEVGKRFALAVEAKNGISKEQLMIQVFSANPNLSIHIERPIIMLAYDNFSYQLVKMNE